MSVVENRREVAYRMFAAEFDDASLSYSEGDEERAPNYVVTPTGARVNRLFAVGVLTEIENVNEEVLRGRIVDPSGAFVTYAGQYQPEAMAFLDRATPPAFVSLTGKARTYQPEDSDRVFTSVRPESINDVDADTRDRWVVSAAEATLERVATFAAALEMDERGDDLRRALEARGVDESLATGIPMAIDHYGTTEHYLEAVRRLAVEALDLVSGDRESVSSLDVAPGDDGPDTLGSLPELDLGDYSPVEPAAEATDEDALEDELTAAETVESTVEDADGLAGEDAVSEADVAVADDAAADVQTADGDAETTDADETGAESRATDSPAAETAASDPEDATTTPEPVPDAGETAAEGVEETPEPAGDASSVVESDDAPTDPEPGASAGADATGDDADATEELGDFGGDEPADEDAPASSDELGDFATDESPTAESDELTANGADADSDSTDEAAAAPSTDEMYEMDEEERREVEEEFGTEFSTGTEVEAPGEADIDVAEGTSASDRASPDDVADADEVAGESGPASGGVDAETATTESESVETAAADESETVEADSDADESEPAADVNLEDAAVDVMSELDDGDGADREAVVAAVVDQYGADESDVEDAIEDALMGGKCYEPAEGTLKSI
ncbi:hypothetical protein SAMN04488063_1477 [Halopelagius inordinatus]|uniref:Rpa-associated protein n=1 Tax=Halopelagius inordinatus TaxID=553467 RepID=A0A1I2P8P7_9EURY|nr:hypothetical protein [Halopelagius inordinatus]SFG11883.1 hypothetical protein SAMN04488063_1477 [Halopelagius inordinatus]